MYKVAVLTISDKCSKGLRVDETGRIAQDLVNGLPGKVVKYEIIPDEVELINFKGAAEIIDMAEKLILNMEKEKPPEFRKVGPFRNGISYLEILFR